MGTEPYHIFFSALVKNVAVMIRPTGWNKDKVEANFLPFGISKVITEPSVVQRSLPPILPSNAWESTSSSYSFL